jgi:hypothetical protein
MAEYLEASKKLRTNAEDSGLRGSPDASSDFLAPSDFPYIRYWMKHGWKKHLKETKDSSPLEPSTGTRGGSRAAEGENVMMQYIEEADGTPISAEKASQIRGRARSIWIGFYPWGLAPDVWGDASKEARDQYYCEMEKHFPVLRYCENHWKAQAVATSIYSQWFRLFDSKKPHLKRPIKDEDNTDDEPDKKRLKTAIEDTSGS